MKPISSLSSRLLGQRGVEDAEDRVSVIEVQCLSIPHLHLSSNILRTPEKPSATILTM